MTSRTRTVASTGLFPSTVCVALTHNRHGAAGPAVRLWNTYRDADPAAVLTRLRDLAQTLPLPVAPVDLPRTHAGDPDRYVLVRVPVLDPPGRYGDVSTPAYAPALLDRHTGTHRYLDETPLDPQDRSWH